MNRVRFGSPLDRREPLSGSQGPLQCAAGLAHYGPISARFIAWSPDSAPRNLATRCGHSCLSGPENRLRFSLFLRTLATTPHLVARFSVGDWQGVTTTPLHAVRFPLGVPNATAKQTCGALDGGTNLPARMCLRSDQPGQSAALGESRLARFPTVPRRQLSVVGDGCDLSRYPRICGFDTHRRKA